MNTSAPCSIPEWAKSGKPIIEYPAPLGKPLGKCTGRELARLVKMAKKEQGEIHKRLMVLDEAKRAGGEDPAQP